MNVFLTGAKGFLGSAIARRTRGTGSGGIYVIHAGARTRKKAGPETKEEKRQYFVDNVDRTKEILNELDVLPVEHFLYVSTLDVTRTPRTAYAESKLEAEGVCREWAGKRNIPYCIARLTQLYGPGESEYEKIIPTLIRNAIRNKPTVIQNDGRSQRDFLYVDDAARAIILLSRHRARGMVNIASGSSVKIRRIVEIVSSQIPLSVRYLPFEKQDRQHATSAAIKRYGFVPSTSLEKGIAREIAYEKNHRL